jgi:hypothetical protein
LPTSRGPTISTGRRSGRAGVQVVEAPADAAQLGVAVHLLAAAEEGEEVELGLLQLLVEVGGHLDGRDPARLVLAQFLGEGKLLVLLLQVAEVGGQYLAGPLGDAAAAHHLEPHVGVRGAKRDAPAQRLEVDDERPDAEHAAAQFALQRDALRLDRRVEDVGGDVVVSGRLALLAEELAEVGDEVL